MKEDNKKFIDPDQFKKRILKIMELKNMTMDDLYDALNNEVGYEISKNNIGVYIQRSPNTNFLYAICKALGVSSDYLLGLSDENILNSGFDYGYREKRYKKYLCENYYFYYYPTVSNSPTKINVAKLSINFDGRYKAELKIQTDENEQKRYIGEFILSKNYEVGYINLIGINVGEIVNLSFHDPNINGEMIKTEILVGAMLSVSCGDFKRAPVMSKFILSRHKIDDNHMDAIKANLTLNNKYIEIDEDCFKAAFNSIDLDDSLKKKIMLRLTSAFQGNNQFKIEESIEELDLNSLLKMKIFSRLSNSNYSSSFNEIENIIIDSDLNKAIKREILTDLSVRLQGNTYFRFEEAFILNTVAKDFKLSFEQSINILNALRIKSISNANCKINHKVDSRLYDILKPNEQNK